MKKKPTVRSLFWFETRKETRKDTIYTLRMFLTKVYAVRVIYCSNNMQNKSFGTFIATYYTFMTMILNKDYEDHEK